VAHVRPPAVAGTFYPGDPRRLTAAVDGYLSAVAPRSPEQLFALVVPHAGYVYSGPIAASAYALLKALPEKPERIALFGPSHFVGFSGLALPEADSLRTPLGDVAMDPRAVEVACGLPGVIRSDAVHAREHSLEVQLPFLQRVLPAVPVLPFAVGRAKPEQVAAVMEAMRSIPKTLLLVSTDLSHYLSSDEARQIDAITAAAVTELKPEEICTEQACGSTALKALLLLGKKAAASAVQLDLRNSSDTAGDPDRVVGYGAFALYEAP
jgi:MEMO1 family protein